MGSKDVIIVGGGIIGLSSAYQLTLEHPDRSILIIEKEASLSVHQTGHNSGVLHSGIYYKPGSLKARNCRSGLAAMVAFCREQGIKHEVCGKVIVAVDAEEEERLEALHQRGLENGVTCELIDRKRLRELEPHCAGNRAIFVNDAGIVDYSKVCHRLAELVVESGAEILTGTRVEHVIGRRDGVVVETTQGSFESSVFVNCAGLHSDRVTAASGTRPSVKILPFRGEFYQLKPSAMDLFRNLIYPVPDPRYPFLGVHFTRKIDGIKKAGPNAVLAFAREGYGRWRVSPRDLMESVTYPGFLRMAREHWRMGMDEMHRSFSKAAFVRAGQRLLPDLHAEDLEEAPSGVRAQAVARNGKLVDDFAIQETDRMVHVVNAPSPAATAALSIGKLVAEKAATRLS